MNDFRYGLRSLLRMRGVAALAIVTLAVGIGATTTMFSAVDAALLRPVPFDDPDRLVMLFMAHSSPREGRTLERWSKPIIDMLVPNVTSYEAIASYSPTLVSISGGNDDPEQIDGEIVSPEYFGLLHVAPVAGRTFTVEEDRAAGQAPVAILGEPLWRRRYAADPGLIGRVVRVNGVLLTVVGIMPAGFSGLSDKAQLWIPRTMAPQLTYAEYLTSPQHFIALVARLKRDVTLERANAELAALTARMSMPPDPEGGRWSAVAQRIGDARVDPAMRRSLLLLMTAAASVLLISCANVTGLLLARGRVRGRELAIRLSIGAGRGRIVRLVLIESLLLAVIAGALGAVLAVWGVGVFARYAPGLLWTGRVSVATFSSPAPDARALLFAVGATAVTSLLAGLAPALEISSTRLTDVLKSDERSGGGRRRIFRGLVVAEVALAVLLLAGAGVLLDGFARAQRMRTGFNEDGIVTFWVRPPVSRYRVEEGPAVVERLLTSVERVRGVESAAVNRCTPFTGCSRSVVSFADRPNDPQHLPGIGRHYVSADYFKTLGIPLLAGRTLTAGDRAGRPPVTVISESAARRFWPGESPIGKRVWFGGTTGPFVDPAHAVEIVGIVGDVKYEAVDWPGALGRPEFYTSYLQFSYPDTMIIVRTHEPIGSIVPALRHAIASVDPVLPIYDVMTLDERIHDSLAVPRFNASLIAGFAGAAVLIAALGVYVMLSYSVSVRLREIGVRIALGAAPPRIVGLVLREGLTLAAFGIVIGLFAAAGAARLARSLVADLGSSQTPMLAGVAIVMLLVASSASLVPARRAASVDPILVLRHD